MAAPSPRDTSPDTSPETPRNTAPEAGGEGSAAAPLGPPPSTINPVAPRSPFADETKVLRDRTMIRDELSQAQSSPTAARKLGARHISRLIYSLQYAPGVVDRHTAPYSIYTS